MRDRNLCEYERQREDDWQEWARVQVVEGAIRDPLRYCPRLILAPLRELEPEAHWQARAVVKALFTPVSGPWIAVFCDGPAVGRENDRHWACGPIYGDLYLIPHPSRNVPGYICVGYGEEPEEPWPGQLHYERVETIEASGNDGETVAQYRMVRDAEP